jgi:uncharacterized protein
MTNGRRVGVEFKCSDAPQMTRSIRSTIEDLRLDEVCIVYPGKQSYALDEQVEVVSVQDIAKLADK